MILLVIFQLALDAYQYSFLLYMPPIGFALLVFVLFFVQPLIMGVLNIVLMHRLYDCEGWQIGFWLNGLFLFLVFSTINVLIQTLTGALFSLGIGLLNVILLSYPFGYLGKFSNRGDKRNAPLQQSTS